MAPSKTTIPTNESWVVEWPADPVADPPSHPLVLNLRDGIFDYRVQSASHWAIPEISVMGGDEQSSRKVILTEKLQKRVRLAQWPYLSSKNIVCRPKVSEDGKVTHKVEVYDRIDRSWISLSVYLEKEFPPNPSAVDDDTMRSWWDNNGRSFDFLRLPDELKINVLTNCIKNSGQDCSYYTAVNHAWNFKGIKPGPYEIIDVFEVWRGLLGVPIVRGYAMQLAIEGNEKYGGGLALLSTCVREFQDQFWRLGNYYQMIQPEGRGVPRKNRPWEKKQARNYKDHPLQYPQFSHFATLRHGLRKLAFSMPFLDALIFWKVNIDGFEEAVAKHFKENGTCDVFEQLPNLDGFKILLPCEPWKQRSAMNGCKKIWHEEEPCPRVLHRTIYHQIAKVLARYEDVQVLLTMDFLEKDKFHRLHDQYHQAERFKKVDLDELYAECNGGIELTENQLASPVATVKPVVNRILDEDRTLESDLRPVMPWYDKTENFWPPICRCDPNKCRDVFENARLYPWDWDGHPTL